MLSDISQLQKGVLYDSIYEVHGVVRFIGGQSRMVVQGLEEEGMERWFNGTRISVYKKSSGDGWWYLIII